MITPCTTSQTLHAIDLLRDRRGIYGIGINDLYRETADSRENPFTAASREDILVVRPDKLREGYADLWSCYSPALQPIFGGYRRSIFYGCKEEHFRKLIHHQMLNRAGLPWPAETPWWSDDPARQAINRGKYHGFRMASLKVINSLIREALAVADQAALRQARRFPLSARRYQLYAAGAADKRNLQAIEAFPTLATVVFGGNPISADPLGKPVLANWKDARAEAKQMILRGQPLRDVADRVGVPWCLKRVKPGAVIAALRNYGIDPALVDAWLPQTTLDMKVWLRAVAYASRSSPDFARWCAKNVMSDRRIGGNRNGAPMLADIADWVTASLRASVPLHIRQAFGEARSKGGEEFVTRIFSQDMSLETVLKLSGEWHTAVANHITGPQCQFPPPWFPAQQIEDYEFVPIETAADLYLEGKALHHCAGTYAERARFGDICFASLRANGGRVATVAFKHGPSGPVIEQVRGPCNALVPAIEKTLRKWLRKQRVTELAKPVPLYFEQRNQANFTPDLIDDLIPF